MHAPSRKPRKSKIEIRVDRHTSSLLTLHLVLTPKFRAKILVGGVAVACERIIRKTCKNLEIDIIQIAVAEDHVHLFIQYPPRLASSRIIEAIKSNTSRELREKFPHLVSWCNAALWAPGGFHGSVGQGFDVVEKYIAGQKQAHRYNRS